VSNVTGIGVNVRPSNEWAVYDSLPARLRAALQEAAVQFDACGVAEGVGKLLAAGHPMAAVQQRMLRQIEDVEAFQVAMFAARRWPARFGRYPHLAAGATIQRYGRRA
jgi:hypothetical protein